MLNTDIFDFEFVDRTTEREKFNSFLNFSHNNNQVLWLHGKRGVGKTFFITETVAEYKDIFCVRTNVSETVPNGYINEFEKKLNESAKLKFIDYLKTNYKSIVDIGEKTAKVLLNFAKIDDKGISTLGAGLTNYFISKQDEKENSYIVFKKYIQEVVKKNGPTVFVLDNFSMCDSGSLELLSTVIHELKQNKNVKFVICTTDNDLERRADIKEILAEKISNIPLVLHPFSNKTLFARMLERVLDIDENNVTLLSQVFALCCGYPQRFKEFLINLYVKDGIFIDKHTGKAQFSHEIFREMLLRKVITFDVDNLSIVQKHVLEIIGLWGVPIQTAILQKYISFLLSEDPLSQITEKIAIETIETLEGAHILAHIYEDNMVLISFEHDSLQLAVQEYFRGERSVAFEHFSMFSFLKTQQENKNSPYFSRYYTPLLAYHAYEAHVPGWIELNYTFAGSLYTEGLYKEAETIFLRLEKEINILNGPQLLLFAKNEFYCGKYSKSEEILSQMVKRGYLVSLDKNTQIDFYIIQAKVKACLLNSKAAIASIESAEAIDTQNKHKQVEILGAKQSILFLSPDGYTAAKRIFDDLVEMNVEVPEMAKVYLSAMDYYEGKDSLTFLQRSIRLAHQFSDKITEGKALNNMAFEYVRGSDYSNADTFFQNSISILQNCQSHELAYPYSNLAVLKMIDGNWEMALDYIVEALFWNRSAYASLVLTTNRMICYFFLKNDEWKKIYLQLYGYIKSDHAVDDKIYKKICINLALIAMKTNHTSDAIDQLHRCKPHLKNEWNYGKYRFSNLFYKLTGEAKPKIEVESKYFKYYGEIEFEPWLLNFTHD